MHIRQVGLGALLILTLLLPLTGACDKSTPEAANSRTSEARKDRSTEAPVIARLHWLGKKRISAETNAAYFMTIWNLPESKKLEEQILDKLASAPWRLLLQQTGTSTGSALFRPLLNDLLNEESYLEISQPSNQPGSLVFGIRLDRPRALLWETNLARIMESLTDLTISKTAVAGVERGWMLKKHDKPNLFEFAQIDGWTLLGWSQDQNPLLENIIARIHNEPLRFPGAVSNFWLEASLDLQRSADALLLRRKLPEGFPSLAISVIGDGTNVRTRADFTFRKPLELEMGPWIVPTNLVREPLISFTAVRGIAQLWQGATLLSDLNLKNLPNQLYVWALSRVPFQTFAASPLDDTTNFLRTVGPQLAERLNSKSGPNSGSIIVASNNYSLVWTGVPFATPYLRPETDSGRQFLLAGLFPNTLRTNGPPKELLDQFMGSTNVTYYDWEVTQERLIQLRYIDDLCHIAFDSGHKPRLRSDLASVKWLGSMATKLGNSVTEVALASSNRLNCQRKSSVGLTGVELELLANWFETPDFPSGLLDFLKMNVKQSVSIKSNSLPAIK